MGDAQLRVSVHQSVQGDGSSGVLLDLMDTADESGTAGAGILLDVPGLLWAVLHRLVVEDTELAMWVPNDSEFPNECDQRPLTRRDLAWIRRLVDAHAADSRSYPLSFWVVESGRRWAAYEAIDRAHEDRMSEEAMSRAIADSVCRVAVFRSSITVSFAPTRIEEIVGAVDSALVALRIEVTRDA